MRGNKKAHKQGLRKTGWKGQKAAPKTTGNCDFLLKDTRRDRNQKRTGDYREINEPNEDKKPEMEQKMELVMKEKSII